MINTQMERNVEAPTLISGKPIPYIIYGTALRHVSASIDIKSALLAGYAGIDTACSRRLHDEISDGVALQNVLRMDNAPKRSDILVQTKYVPPISQAAPWPYRVEDDLRTQIFASILRSCDDLNMAILDVLFLSEPLRTLEESLEAWRAMEEVVLRGGIRYLGVCHPSLEFLETLHDAVNVKPMFIQVRYDRINSDQGGLRRFCVKNGIVAQVFGILWSENNGLLQLGAVRKLANMRGISIKVALFSLIVAEALYSGLKLCIVDGSRQEQHMSENMDGIRSAHDIPSPVVAEFQKELQDLF